MWDDKDLQQATFRGVEFDFVDIEDGLKKTIAKFDYPYADGSDLEDMGLEERTIRLKAVLFGDKYGSLQAFLEALKEQGYGELNHPVFGTIKAMPETVSIRHDEKSYHAEIDISFLEHLELAISRVAANVDTAASANEAVETMAGAADNMADVLEDAGIPDGIPIDGLGVAGYMATIAGYTSKVRSVMSKIDSAVGTLNSYINTATAPFKLITSAVEYATDLPGTILGKAADAIETVAGTYNTLIAAPGKFMDSLNYGLGKIEDALGDFEGGSKSSDDTASTVLALKAAYSVSAATALAQGAAIELAADEAAENGKTFSLKPYGIDSDVERTQVMTIDEIDLVAATAREAINTAITAVRDVYGDSGYDLTLSLKTQALLIQQAADEIRLRRERIIDYEVPSDMPLHILAFNLYGDISEAERLLRINQIRNPNFLRAGETLRVYA